jgi:F-type H+-transporting ATPase subunit gamma
MTRQMMPIEMDAVTEAPEGPRADYEYEPEPDGILDSLLPRYAEARLFAAMLDSTASFFAAQQRAMKSATDNAEELITVLSRQMNRARQESITTEILEIVGGAEALAQAASGETDYLIDRTFASDLLPN